MLQPHAIIGGYFYQNNDEGYYSEMYMLICSKFCILHTVTQSVTLRSLTSSIMSLIPGVFASVQFGASPVSCSVFLGTGSNSS